MRKITPFFKCKWCEKMYEGVAVYMEGEELLEAIAKNLLSSTHACDNKRQGVGDLIGFKKP